jgi:hemoglobin/transferrin/lactoferrin receptor protein
MMPLNRSVIFVAVLGAFSASLSRAEDSVLPEVTVVATKTKGMVDTTPASVSVAGEQRFDEIQASSIQPVVRAMPNVEMGGGPRLDGLTPTIRGVSGASITLLLDGARQNDVMGPGMKSPLYSDPYFLKQIEVLRGASSSLYGSGGNGGVMSLTTLSARDLLDPGQLVGGGVKAGYSSGDTSTHLNARLYGGNDVVDALVAVGKHDWDKIRKANGGYWEPNDGDSTTALVKLGVTPVKDTRIELSHQSYESDNLAPNNPLVGRYKKTTDTASIPFIQPTHIKQQNTVLKASSGMQDAIDSPYLEASLYQNALKVVLDPYGTNSLYSNAATTNFSLTETKTDGANFQATKAYGNHRVSLGADYFHDKLASLSGSTVIAVNAVNPAGERKGIGAYLQDEYRLAENWRLIPTVRYDQYEATVSTGVQPTNEKSRLSPKATLAWDINASLMAYGSYGEGFRAPTVSELFQNSTVGTFSWFLRNPDLKPEVDRTVELGSKFKQTNLFASGDVLRLRGALFYSKVEDLISSVNLGNIPGQTSCATTGLGCRYQYQNIANAHRYGGELEASYALGTWQYNLAYGHVRVSNTDSNENLFSTPDKLTAQIRKQFPALGLSFLWNSTFVAAQDYDSTTLRRRSGYALHDTFLTWAPAGYKFRVDAGVTNLFDKAYVVYQSSNIYANTYQEGRAYRASLSVDF